MARIFISGSADGLGLLAAKALIEDRHRVVLHARNTERGRDAMARAAGAEAVLTADLNDLAAVKRLAAEINDLGAFDGHIHNAAVYHSPGREILAVNVLAPFILTCLTNKPSRLIY